MKIITALATLALVAGMGVAQAADTPANKKKQTDAGLYVTAIEAAAMKKAEGEGVLFVDVRDPIEVMFTGSASSVDANIPFKTANPAKWNPKKSTYAMESNPAFLDAMRNAVAEQGLTPDDPIMLMCRSGGRSAAAVNALVKAGFTKVYSVVDGFEGDVNKKAENGPVRSLNGWKNSGLPWTAKLNQDVAYLPAKQRTEAPYAGQQKREIAALSPKRMEGLREGRGLGYAKAAELNGYPGPLHVLELATALELSDEVTKQVEAIRADMLADAKPLGEAMIDAEKALDALFKSGNPAAADIDAATATIGQIDAQLRAAHLKAHLRTTPLLTRHQRMIYAKERGYGAGHGHGHGHGH